MIKQKIGNLKDGAARAQPRSIRRIALFSFACFALLICVRAGISHADGAAFDLAGPPVEMRVTRDGKTLPISRIANLQPGDRLWIHPALPDTQSVHYLLVVAFLRGSTNPPPETWFTRVETWTKQAREEGIVVTVPQDAQQALQRDMTDQERGPQLPVPGLRAPLRRPGCGNVPPLRRRGRGRGPAEVTRAPHRQLFGGAVGVGVVSRVGHRRAPRLSAPQEESAAR